MAKQRGTYGKGHIEQLGPKRYKAFTPPLPTAAGERRKRTKQPFSTRKEAQAWIDEQVALVETEPGSYDAWTTLDEYAAAFLTTKAGTVASNTLDFYRRNLTNHVLPMLGSERLSDLTVARLKAWRVALTNSGRSVHVVRAALSTLSAVLSDAVDDEILRDNPLFRVDKPQRRKRASAPGRREIVWSDRELASFISGIRGHRLEHLYRLLAGTGMRRGEAIGLRWSRVDMAGWINIDTQVVEPDTGGWEFGPPKSRHSLRTIGVGEAVLDSLRAQRRLVDCLRRVRLEGDYPSQVIATALAGRDWHGFRPAEVLQALGIRGQEVYSTFRVLKTLDWTEHDLVFPNLVGNPTPGYEVSKEFSKLVSALELPPIVLHGLRHRFITAAFDGGYPPKAVAEYVGDRVETILQHYTHRTGAGDAGLAAFGSALTELTAVELRVKSDVEHEAVDSRKHR